jgi:hypothetical protein
MVEIRLTDLPKSGGVLWYLGIYPNSDRLVALPTSQRQQLSSKQFSTTHHFAITYYEMVPNNSNMTALACSSEFLRLCKLAYKTALNLWFSNSKII